METPKFPLEKFETFFRDVYEPAEDTFLLIDAIEADLNEIFSKKPVICMEIGCGSGAVITSLANAFSKLLFKAVFIATDINFKAIECTKLCQEVNCVESQIDLILTDLATCFDGRLNRSVDLLLFNPPYVPTDEEPKTHDISASWVGGDYGRTVIDRFLSETINKLLSDTGLAYMLILDKNDFNQIKITCNKYGLHCQQVIYRRCGIEKLSVIKISRFF